MGRGEAHPGGRLRPPERVPVSKGWKMLTCNATVALIAVVAASWPVAAEEAPARGKEIAMRYQCARCHSIISDGIQMGKPTEEQSGRAGSEEEVVPPDLSGIGSRRNRNWLDRYLRKEIAGEAGNKHVMRFRGRDEEREALLDFLMSLTTPVESHTSGEQ